MRMNAWTRRSTRLAAGILTLGVALAGCGGGSKSSSSTGSTGSTTAALKRLEVQVTGTSTAQAPATSLLARLGQLVGWPAAAEASVGLQGCTVTASTLPGVSVTTDGEGKAILVDVIVPATVSVSCPDGSSGQFPISGPPGAVVTVKVETKPGKLEVRSRHGAEDPSISQPSTPSVPSKPQSGSS